MFYLVSYKTKQIIRDEKGRPVISFLNVGPEISAAVKQYGAVWGEPVYQKAAAALTVHAKLTEEDMEYISSIPTPTQPIVVRQKEPEMAGNLFDFM